MASWSATPSLSALLIRDCCFRAHSASSSLPEAASESESAPPGPSSEDESPPSESASKNRLTKPIFLTTRPPSFFPGFTNFGALTVIPFKNVELAGFLSTTGRAVTCVPIAGLTRTTGAGTRAAAFATAASALALLARMKASNGSSSSSPLLSFFNGGNPVSGSTFASTSMASLSPTPSSAALAALAAFAATAKKSAAASVSAFLEIFSSRRLR
mmetsp:Transcript_7719/g.34436  ORF Transcript_7719/g.34436 Transcript_7719/m.34436 type:complete len:214 (-) Transcript_7719:949-1590(-)